MRLMKNMSLVFAVTVISALLMASCKKEKVSEEGKTIIRATMDGPRSSDEKTHFGPTANGNTPTHWSTDDKVSVFSGSECTEFVMIGDPNFTVANFCGERPTANSAYCAFYPSSMNPTATQNGDAYTLSFELPATQIYHAPYDTVPSISDDAYPMVAYSTDVLNYQFKNMTGVLRIDLKGIGKVGKIVLKDGDEDAQLWGTASVTVNTQGATPELTSNNITGGNNELTLVCETGVKLRRDKATSFFFVVPVGTLGKIGKGFSFEVYNVFNHKMYFSDKSNVVGRVIQRSVISHLAVAFDRMDYDPLPGKFSINEEGGQVQFSPGNLMYMGGSSPAYWKFAESQHAYLGQSTHQNSANNVDRDLFGYGDVTGHNTSKTDTDYQWQEWGTVHSGYLGDGWRTLANDEWVYIINDRPNAANLRGWGQISDTLGVILLPDDWTACPAGLTFVPMSDENHINAYTLAEWFAMEDNGAVFLTAAGYREGTLSGTHGNAGLYKSSTPSGNERNYGPFFRIYPENHSFSIDDADGHRCWGESVRLVHVVE